MKLLDIVKSVKETREGIRELYEDFEYLRHYEKSLVILLLISSVTLTFGIDWSPTEAEEAEATVITAPMDTKITEEESKIPDISDSSNRQHWNCSYEFQREQELKESADNDAEVDANVDADAKDWSLQYGEDEFEGLLFLAYSEVGGQDVQEDKDLICAVVHSILNSCKAREISPWEEAFRTQGAYANAETSSRQIFCGEGVVTRDLISPEFEELCWDCWTGNIPSPIDDWYCFMTPSLMGYEYCPICWFAADMGIETYQEIGNGIFFPQESYTPKLQAYIDNGYSWEKDTDD